MPLAGAVLGLAGLIVIVAVQAGHGLEVSNGTEVLENVEGRLQSYDSYWYNDVNYWWPWFSDLATVIAIKLKIAIGLAAIYAFGDGYYWTKSKSKTSEYSTLPEYGTEIGGGFWDKFRWSEPSSFLCGWGHGRRRRRRDLSERKFEEDNFAEYLFDSLKEYDDDCQRRVVCEMDFEFRGNSKVHRAIVKYNDQVLGWRDGNVIQPEWKEDCKKLFGRCRLAKKDDEKEKAESRENALESQS